MAFLDWIGIVRALFGMLHADGDVLAAAAGFTHAMRPNGAVQCAGDDLWIGRSVMEHLLLNGLRAFLQRAVHARAELQIGRHVGQVIPKIVKALQFHRHLPYLPKKQAEKSRMLRDVSMRLQAVEKPSENLRGSKSS